MWVKSSRTVLIKNWVSVLAVGVVCAAGEMIARADKIDLKDGRSLNGSLVRSGEKVVITTTEGAVVSVLPTDVMRVTLISNLTPEEKARSEWVRAQTLIKRSENLAEIIKLHQDILLIYQQTATGEAVGKSLAEYQQYATEGRIKFRGQWVSPDDRQRVLRGGFELANKALESYTAGKLSDAKAQAAAALKVDDQSTLAFTVIAMTALRENKQGEARTAFLELTKVDPANLLAWNNLAIIAFRQRSDPEGLAYYNKAIQIAPEHRLLLDNIAEALNQYEGPTDTRTYVDLARAFTQADSRKQAEMAEKGFYRFGGTWVNKEQRDAISRSTTDVINQANAMEQQYQNTRSSLATLGAAYEQSKIDYDAAVSTLYYLNTLIWANQARGLYDVVVVANRDSQTATVNLAAKKVQDLSEQLAATRQGLDTLKGQAEQLKPALAAARASIYSNVQRIMEPGDVENPPAPLPVNAPVAKPVGG